MHSGDARDVPFGSLAEAVSTATKDLFEAELTLLNWSAFLRGATHLGPTATGGVVAQQAPELRALASQLQRIVSVLVDALYETLDFVEVVDDDTLPRDLPPSDPTAPATELVRQAQSLSRSLADYLGSMPLQTREDTVLAVLTSVRIAWSLRHAFEPEKTGEEDQIWQAWNLRHAR